MGDLARSSKPIDIILLPEELRRRGELDLIGGEAYISGLLDGVPDRPSISHYVDIVKEKAARRSAIRAFGKLTAQCYDDHERIDDTLVSSAELIHSLQEQHRRDATPPGIRMWSQIPTLDQLPTEEVSWVVDGILPAGSVVLWARESGSYKTWLSLLLANAVQTGTDFLERKTQPRPVLYLDRENPASLLRERRSMLGIRASENFRIWGSWQSKAPPLIGDPRLLEIVKATRPLIVIDSLIRFHEADENSATEMGRVMADLRSLASNGASVLVQHHKPKAEGGRYRGSSDIKVSVR